jgi:FMN-dependent NADH-azoreductase
VSMLLYSDSSPLYGRSVSRELTASFVAQWKSLHPDGLLVDRNLNATAISPITSEWVGAACTPEEARTPEQKKLLSLSDSLLSELELADEYVFGVPMHNFGVLTLGAQVVDRPDCAHWQDLFLCEQPRAQRPACRQESQLHHRNRWHLRRPDRDGLVQFRGAVSALVFGFLGVTEATFIKASGTAARRAEPGNGTMAC